VYVLLLEVDAQRVDQLAAAQTRATHNAAAIGITDGS
jgi:hypothetical protein